MELAVRLTVLVLSIVFHEVAHGYAAYRLGDPTARDAKRLTLNPLAHIDPMGSVVLPLFLVITNSPVLFGWAKPVPFNPGYFRDARKGMMIVGAAGPAANLLLAVLAAAAFRLLTPSGLFGLLLVHACIINVVLALFNLIPIPPLDGSRVVVGFLPLDLARSYLKIERFGFLIVFGLLWFGVLDRVLWPLADGLLRILLSA